MSTIVGVDLSSYQLDFAILHEDRVAFSRVVLGIKDKDNIDHRLSQVAGAFTYRHLPHVVDFTLVEQDAILAVEEPSGKTGHPYPIWQVFGAVKAIASGEVGMHVETLAPNQWRKELGAYPSTSKAMGHGAVDRAIYAGKLTVESAAYPLTPDQFDALGIALAMRSIVNRQKEAA